MDAEEIRHLQNSQLAASVVNRLIDKLNEIAQPEIVIDRDGNRSELRNWLMLHCFGRDHELYDDIRYVLSMGRQP